MLTIHVMKVMAADRDMWAILAQNGERWVDVALQQDFQGRHDSCLGERTQLWKRAKKLARESRAVAVLWKPGIKLTVGETAGNPMVGKIAEVNYG